MDEAPRVVGLAPPTALLTKGFAIEAEDVPLRREGVVRGRRRVVATELEAHRLRRVLPLDCQAIALLACLEAAVGLKHQHVKAVALERDGDRRPADATTRNHNGPARGYAAARAAAAAAQATAAAAAAARGIALHRARRALPTHANGLGDVMLAGARESPLGIVKRLVRKLVQPALRRRR